MYRYEINCYLPDRGVIYDEKSGWYKDSKKCSEHCLARINGNTFKKEMTESDCPYSCLIEVYVVTNDEIIHKPDSFSRYNVIKRIKSSIDPSGHDDTYFFEVLDRFCRTSKQLLWKKEII